MGEGRVCLTATVTFAVYVAVLLIDGPVENAGGVGLTDDSVGTTNMVSWKLKVVPPAVTPERPTAAVKGKVKA